ncbi:MAG: hypothetical protein ABIQ95_11135 [Bdellovibrionia bacterium]
MKKIMLLVIALASISAFASEEICYQVSSDGKAWSRTSETLCVSTTDFQTNQVEIVLKSGLSFAQQTIATFNYNLLSSARCMDCNQNVYGIANPSNSIFNAFSIRFDGTRNMQTGSESGVVQIGDTKLYYRGPLANSK